MGLEAATKALLDAGIVCHKTTYIRHTSQLSHYADAGLLSNSGITYDSIETAFVGYCYGDSTCGQVRS